MDLLALSVGGAGAPTAASSCSTRGAGRLGVSASFSSSTSPRRTSFGASSRHTRAEAKASSSLPGTWMRAASRHRPRAPRSRAPGWRAHSGCCTTRCIGATSCGPGRATVNSARSGASGPSRRPSRSSARRRAGDRLARGVGRGATSRRPPVRHGPAVASAVPAQRTHRVRPLRQALPGPTPVPGQNSRLLPLRRLYIGRPRLLRHPPRPDDLSRRRRPRWDPEALGARRGPRRAAPTPRGAVARGPGDREHGGDPHRPAARDRGEDRSPRGRAGRRGGRSAERASRGRYTGARAGWAPPPGAGGGVSTGDRSSGPCCRADRQPRQRPGGAGSRRARRTQGGGAHLPRRDPCGSRRRERGPTLVSASAGCMG